ncbi:MAG: acyltransferase [Oscillospiraceae bacterium]|nr:acyltransferase [Oscillospiraceae bacterium]
MALKQGRNYGIDLLRMVAMYMVCILHVLLHGGVLLESGGFSGQHLLSWFLEYGARCAVNLYALISGFVGIKSKYRVSNLAVLWLQVFLYSFGIAVAVLIVRPDFCSGSDLVGFAFPVLTKKYWYFSAYFCLFLFMPLLNAGINTLGKSSMRRTVIAMFLVFSVAASIAKQTSHSPFSLNSGFSGLWLMILYVLGAYIRKYGFWEKVPQPALLGIWLGCTAASLGIRITAEQIGIWLTGVAYNATVLLAYISPLMVLGSVALLLFFARLQCGNISKRIIAFFAPAAFGVYIIHMHPLIGDHLLYHRFSFIADYSPFALVAAVILCAFGIYLICSLIDLVRIQVFKLLKIKQRCLALEEKLKRRVYDIETRTKLRH